jgi:S-DNA-T family DNA segregation ATPase FtsK/SpoIIIE
MRTTQIYDRVLLILAALAAAQWLGGVHPPLLPPSIAWAEFACLALFAAAALVLALGRRRALPARATRLLGELGLCPKNRAPRIVRSRRRGSVWEIAWRMPAGTSVASLERRRDEIEESLDVSAEFWFDRGLVHMRAAAATVPDHVSFGDFYRAACPSGELTFGIGFSRQGALWADITSLPHLLIGGQTSGGKSAFMRQLVTWLAMRHDPLQLRLALVDMKGGLELSLFQHLPHVLGPVGVDLDSCLRLMEVLLKELDQRQVALRQLGAEDIRRWNGAVPGRRLPYVLVVVDEMAELAAVESMGREEKARRQAALASISRMCRLGRALGFHVIASTQRPDADAVPGQIKANIPATVAFRVRSAVNSRILLGEDNPAAAGLPPVPGRGIWQHHRELRFQGIWLAKAAAEAMLASVPGAETACTERVTPCLLSHGVEDTEASG